MIGGISVLPEGGLEGVLIPFIRDGAEEVARRQPEQLLVHFLQLPNAIDDQRKRPPQPDVLGSGNEATSGGPGGDGQRTPRHHVAQGNGDPVGDAGASTVGHQSAEEPEEAAGQQLGMRLLIGEKLGDQFVHDVLRLEEIEQEMREEASGGVGLRGRGFAEVVEEYGGLLHGGDQGFRIGTLHMRRDGWI